MKHMRKLDIQFSFGHPIIIEKCSSIILVRHLTLSSSPITHASRIFMSGLEAGKLS